MDKPLAAQPQPQPCTSGSRPSCSSSSPTNSTAAAETNTQPSQIDMAVLVLKWLQDSGYTEAANALEQGIDKGKIVPSRIDWTGKSHNQTCQQFLSRLHISNVPPLKQVISRLFDLVNKEVPLPLPNLPCTIIANPTTSLIRTHQSILPQNPAFRLLRRRISVKEKNNIRLLTSRELGRTIPFGRLPHSHFLQNLERHFRMLGHLAHAYCVAFDNNSQFVISGADDNLLKVWNVETGVLRYTFRGHSGEIADLSVSQCNRLLASGGVDKTVRIWSLKNGALLEVFRVHTAMLTRISFLPFVHDRVRYLVTCGYDCNVCFLPYDSQTLEFSSSPIHFNERDGSNQQRIISLCHSPSGAFVAAGDTVANICIYRVQANEVVRLSKFKAHSEKVDSLVWSSNGLQFASSSPDGVAKIWKWSCQKWTESSLVLSADELRKALESMPSSDNERSRNKLKYSVTILCWSNDNKHIVTAGNDKNLRVWDACSLAQLRVLTGHLDECFVLHPHPTYPNIVISCGHDGLLIVWDIEKGEIVKKFANTVDQSGHYALFDLVISSDGMSIAAVDACGQISLFGIGDNVIAKATPKQQFFNTDYMELIQDANGFVVDDRTGLAPHLMPPPILVDTDLTPYADEHQRRVPGKEGYPNEYEDICVWLSRSIIDPLPETARTQFNEESAALREHENEIYEVELAKQPVVQDVFVPLSNRELNRAKAKRAMQTTRAPPQRRREEEVITEEMARERTNEYLNAYDSENDENYSLSEDESNSEDAPSDGSDSSDPDFEAGGGTRTGRGGHESANEEPVVTTLSGRQVKRVDRNMESAAEAMARKERKKKQQRQNLVDDSSSQTSMDDEPGPSTSNQPAEKKEKKIRKRKDEWIRTFPSSFLLTQPHRFPYLPQLGDRVAYFRQGHEFYLELVERNQIYGIPPKMKRALDETAPVMENCLVEEVKYTRKPYRLTSVRLTQLDHDNKPTNKSWTVAYHDLDGCPDFVFLQQHYQKAMSYGFDEGSKIEAILDGNWWIGTVLKKEPQFENVPDSPWYSLIVKWDAGDDERLSPWDVQPLSKGRKSGDEVTLSDELQWAEYVWEAADWPVENAQLNVHQAYTYHTDRLLTAIHALTAMDELSLFYNPVDLSEFPIYPLYIDYPADLKTITERIQQNYYRRLLAIHQDIRYLAIAAEQFNEPTSPLVHNARVLVETLIRYSKDESITDVLVLYYSLAEGPADELIEYKRKQRTVRAVIDEEILQEAVQMHTDAATTSSAAETAKQPGWITESVRIFREIMRDRAANPFLDADQAAAHSQELMEELAECNLTTILEQLQNRRFQTPQEFFEQAKGTIHAWKRCLSDNKRSSIYQHTLTLDRLLQEKMRPVLDEFTRITQHYQLRLQEKRSLRSKNKRNRTPPYQTRSTDNAHRFDGPSTSNGIHLNGRRERESGYYKHLANEGYIDDYEGESAGSADRAAHSSSTRESSRRRGSSQQINGSSSTREIAIATRAQRQPTPQSSSRNKSRRERNRREAESELLDLMDDVEERLSHQEAQKQSRKARKRKSEAYDDELDEDEMPEERNGRKKTRRTNNKSVASHSHSRRATRAQISYAEADSDEAEQDDDNYEESEETEEEGNDDRGEEEERVYTSRSGRVARQRRY